MLMDTVMTIALLAPVESWDQTPLMQAIIKGLMVVGVGTIGWAVINKAKEGDIWSAVSTGVLGALALAFIAVPEFRNGLMDIVKDLTNSTFQSS